MTGLESLDKFLRQELRINHPRVNRGGCCVVAVLLAKHLAKVGTVRIRIQRNMWENRAPMNLIEEARKKVKRNTLGEWNDCDVFFYHVAVEFEFQPGIQTFEYKTKRYHIDVDGVTDDRRFPFLEGELTLKEARELSVARGWNTEFDRSEIPMIKRRIEKYFKQHLKKGAINMRLVA